MTVSYANGKKTSEILLHNQDIIRTLSNNYFKKVENIFFGIVFSYEKALSISMKMWYAMDEIVEFRPPGAKLCQEE